MYCFFFSSRRRHTRCLSDWSSDVCSSDLSESRRTGSDRGSPSRNQSTALDANDLRSEERRVGKGVDLGGRRLIKKKKEPIPIHTSADLIRTRQSEYQLRHAQHS